MGAHFAPPFAIITMSKIENAALQSLREKSEFKPAIYVRYIDDILIGPIDKNSNLPQTILETFNKVNEDIKFTLEIPDKALNFLDLAIKVKHGRIEYSWFEKPCHSQNTLKKESFVPNHVKCNFVSNCFKRVENRCSHINIKNAALTKLKKKLEKNGYRKFKTKLKINKKTEEDNEKAAILQLDFISDSCNRKINRILNKYDFNIKLVSKPAKYLKQTLRRSPDMNKHDHCDVCDHLPDRFRCDDKYLVYKFTCKYCNEFYIGETCRPFKLRYSEHRRSLASKNKTIALAEHAIRHRDVNVTITDFSLEILQKCTDPLQTRLSEATAIDRF